LLAGGEESARLGGVLAHAAGRKRAHPLPDEVADPCVRVGDDAGELDQGARPRPSRERGLGEDHADGVGVPAA
jgi:hypothetical protein